MLRKIKMETILLLLPLIFGLAIILTGRLELTLEARRISEQAMRLERAVDWVCAMQKRNK